MSRRLEDAGAARLTVVSIFGQRISLNRDTVATLLREPVFLQFFAVGAAILILNGGGEYMTPMMREMSFSLLIASQFLVVLCVWLYLYISVWIITRLMDRGAIHTLFLPILTTPISFIMYFMNGLITHLLIDAPISIPILTSHRVIDIVVVLGLEFIYVRFVAPQLPLVLAERAEMAQRNTEQDVQIAPLGVYENAVSAAGMDAQAYDQSESGRTDTSNGDADTPETTAGETQDAAVTSITIANQEIELEQLILIRSEDHYLRFYLKTGELLVRATMRGLVDSVDVSAGIQINRSTWVPFSSAKTVEQRGSWTVLILENGNSEKIANSRRIAVTTALEAYRKKNP